MSAAAVFVFGFALVIVIGGLVALISPGAFLRGSMRWLTPRGLYLAAAARLLIGAAMWLAAPEAKTPIALQVLGAIIALSGPALPVIGLERMRSLFAWIESLGAGAMRAWVLCAGLPLAAFLLWTIVP